MSAKLEQQKLYQSIRIPILGQAFGGRPVPIETLPIARWRTICPIPGSLVFDQFAGVQLTGDSLIEHHIIEDDHIIFRTTRVFEFDHTDLLVIDTPWGRTVKYIEWPGDDTVVLKGANAQYPDQIWRLDEIKILGVVKRIERDL